MLKKLMFLFMIICITAGNSAQASTLNYIPAADATYFEGSGYGEYGNKFYNNTYIYSYKDYSNNFSTPYLKFDLSNEMGKQLIDFSKERIVSAQLKVFLYDAHNYMYNTETQEKYYINNRVDAYFVSDDTWAEPVLNTYSSKVSKPSIDTSLSLGSMDLPIGYQGLPNPSYILNLDSDFLNEKFNEINLNNMISLALINTTPIAGDYWWTQVCYQDREYAGTTKTMLTLETETIPTPEPSSIVLGILSLSGLVFSRRKCD